MQERERGILLIDLLVLSRKKEERNKRVSCVHHVEVSCKEAIYIKPTLEDSSGLINTKPLYQIEVRIVSTFSKGCFIGHTK